MGQDSKIQWTNSTWNPWHGCKKVSPGCKYCYMYRDKERYGQDPTTVIRSKNFNIPYKIQKIAQKNGPLLVFTCSWSDFFIEEADPWRADAWEIIRNTPELTYQILTKRPERILDNLPPDWGEGYPNVWLGVSIEDNDVMPLRIIRLINIPAKVRFISAEPLLGKLRLLELTGLDELFDWIIVGGESGNDRGKYRYRPCQKEWIEHIIYCGEYLRIPVFVKQLGTHLSKELGLSDRHGGDLDEWPKDLKVRQFPKIWHTQK